MKKTNLMATILLSLSSMALLAACGGGNGGGTSTPASQSEAVTYSITLDAAEGITVTGLPEKAAEGDRVSFTVSAAEGKVVDKVTFNGEEITSTTSRYRFTMPAAAVTVKITVSALSSITANASGARTAFFVGNTFEYEGLVVNAVIGGTEKPIASGYTVSTPDMTTEGKKTVTVTYSGLTATYEIMVGTIAGNDIDIIDKDGVPYFVISGTYSGYADVAALTAAAKGMVKVDLQNNGAWTRFCTSSELTFLDNGEGKFKVEIDVSELPGSAAGTGYILHFGLPNGNGGTGSSSDIGQAGDMKFETDSENTGKELVVGNRKYTIATNAGLDGQSNFYGCPSLTVVDESVPTAAIKQVVVEEGEGKVNVVLKGEFSNFDYTQDPELDHFYLDLVQLGGSYTNIADEVVWEFVAEGEDNTKGTFSATIDVTGKMESNSYYFFHYIFGEGAKTQSTDGHNLAWNNKTMETMNLTNASGSYTVEQINNVSGFSWANGLVGIHYLGENYINLADVAIANEEGAAVVTISGTYNGIEDAEKYYVDMMSFDNQVPELDGKISLSLDKEEGAVNGTFEIKVDVTGKLAAEAIYYFHFGEVGSSGNRPNIYKTVAETSVEIADGTYTLGTASGYTENSDTWRNGLAIVTFVGK